MKFCISNRSETENTYDLDSKSLLSYKKDEQVFQGGKFSPKSKVSYEPAMQKSILHALHMLNTPMDFQDYMPKT